MLARLNEEPLGGGWDSRRRRKGTSTVPSRWRSRAILRIHVRGILDFLPGPSRRRAGRRASLGNPFSMVGWSRRMHGGSRPSSSSDEYEMGYTKRMMEEHEDRIQEGLEIAADAGSLGKCLLHDAVYDHGGDHAEAYKLGNSRYTKDTLKNDYESRRQLTDAIKDAIDSAPIVCPICDKLAGE